MDGGSPKDMKPKRRSVHIHFGNVYVYSLHS